MHDGYFQVIADPVSTCVQEIFEFLPGALAALGHEVVDTAASFFVTGVPVLHCRVLDLRIVECDQFDDRGVQLISIKLRRRASFEIRNVRTFFSDNQCAFKLSGLRSC